jgi:hypothetical protein
MNELFRLKVETTDKASIGQCAMYESYQIISNKIQ